MKMKQRRKDSSTSDQTYDKKLVNDSLQLVAKGTGIILIGTIIGSILAAIFPIIIARSYSPAEFGIYALAMTTFLFLVQISFLGLDDGCSRNIAFYRSKKDYSRVKETILSSLECILISGIFASIFLFVSADCISLNMFHNYELSHALKILAFGLPFWILIGIIVIIFRGFDRAKENVIFSHLLLNGGKLLFIVPVIVLGLTIDYIFWAITANTLFVFFIAVLYFKKRIPQEIKVNRSGGSVKKELLLFSIPLVFSSMSWFILQATDKFMIGFSMGEYHVGIYNAAATISSYLNIFLISIMFIYQPVGTKLYGANKKLELKELYQTSTKWIFLITSPLIMLVLLQPTVVVSLLFGNNYAEAMFPLFLLFIAYAIRICLGPISGSIVMLGKTRQLMYIVASAAIVNITLNLSLIPLYGISGAALATGGSLILLSVVELTYLYTISKMQPIKQLYAKMLAIFVIMMVLTYVVIHHLPITFTMFGQIMIVICSYLLFFVFLVLFKLFGEEDLIIVELIEQKAGIKIPLINKLIRKK